MESPSTFTVRYNTVCAIASSFFCALAPGKMTSAAESIANIPEIESALAIHAPFSFAGCKYSASNRSVGSHCRQPPRSCDRDLDGACLQSLLGHFEDHFEFNRQSQRKAGHPDHQSNF